MISIVAGGFFGDEGKGKVVGYLAVHDKPQIIVRAGSGPQAGHTVVPGVKVTQVPSGLVYPKAKLYIARGTLIDPEIFLKEVKENELEGRIFIDGGCTIIEKKHRLQERELVQRIGSVGTGVGPARVDRVMRRARLAKDIPVLKKYITNVSEEVHAAYAKKKDILIEGVQGYGLSLLDSRYYPYVTSQDTTASQFAADTGIGPKMVDNIIVIFKSYISRVGKGLPKKDWTEKEAQKRGIEERGTVSNRKRRLADFDSDMAAQAITYNTATHTVLTCIDRMFPGNMGLREYNSLSREAKNYISFLQKHIHAKQKSFSAFDIISTGPNLLDMVDLRKT